MPTEPTVSPAAAEPRRAAQAALAALAVTRGDHSAAVAAFGTKVHEHLRARRRQRRTT